jgi:hypothetical protein
MKPLKALAVAAIVSFITAGGAVAQEMKAQATVPFNFTVSGKTLPAGTYVVQSPTAGVLQLRNGNNIQSVMTISHHGILPVHEPGKLVFARYGDHYFLKEVSCSAANLEEMLPTSKEEKRVRTQEAMLPGNSNVLVALK